MAIAMLSSLDEVHDMGNYEYSTDWVETTRCTVGEHQNVWLVYFAHFPL